MEKRIYELTVIMSTKKTEKDIKEVVEAILEKVTGRIVDFNFWGKRDLVYPIKKQPTAIFGFFELELEAAKVKDLTSRLRMNDEVWRHMLVAAPEVKVAKKSTKKEVVAEETKPKVEAKPKKEKAITNKKKTTK